MIKQLTLGAVLLSATLLTGCGGGGSSSSSSAAPSYTTLQDLEYKTLNLEEYFHKNTDDTKNRINDSMIFKERYSDGYLVDERSSATGARICTVLDGSEYTYMCYLGFYKENTSTVESAAMYIFNIASDNKVTGNLAYSETANTDELVQHISTRETADAWITGTATTTASSKATSKLTITLNKEQLALSKTNVQTTYKSTQKSEYLNTILTDMKSVISSK